MKAPIAHFKVPLFTLREHSFLLIPVATFGKCIREITGYDIINCMYRNALLSAIILYMLIPYIGVNLANSVGKI